MTSILSAQNLTKQFRGVTAVKQLNLTLQAGVCLGLLGPNGAGKTTTVEMLEGICTPSAGKVLYKGTPLGKAFKDQAGIMFQTTALQEHISVRETLKLFQHLYKINTPTENLIEICSLESFLDRDTHKLSGGQKQRVLLALALVNDPEILFLDEPTTGLDPQSRYQFWQLVQRIKLQHKTIILTTHYMEEAYTLCDEITIMDHGEIIASGSPKELLTEHYHDVIIELPLAALPTTLPSHLHAHLQPHIHNDTVQLYSKDVNETLRLLINADISLQGILIRERTLEDLFLQLTGKDLRP